MRFQRRSNDQHITQAAFSISQYFMCGVTVQALNAQIMLPTVDAVVTFLLVFFYTNHAILILLLNTWLTLHFLLEILLEIFLWPMPN